jgi:two-component system LytT family response regulator
MQALEERLDPAKFMRVHRSIIVRLDLVDTLRKGAGGITRSNSRRERAYE